MPRITRIAGSFAIVMIAYWAYALMAVPWIEPAADLHRGGAISETDRDRGAKLVDIQLERLQGLFPRGAWELDHPIILEGDHATLLFQEYSKFPDGRVKLYPCTIVFAHDGPAKDEAERCRRSIVLEAPAGAVLQFDPPLDLNSFRMGRLVRGQLKDEVRIRSQWKDAGPEDDLLIVTHDIQLTEQTISTPNPVDFHWGPHSGLGREMTIKLLGEPAKPGKEASGPNIDGIESFELRHIERLRLDMGQAVVGNAHPTPAPGQKSENTPVEINCEGPFRFDVVGRVATFHDRVDVRKVNPSGPADQLTCDVLSLYFIERSKENTDPDGGSLDLVAERLEARGNPVIVTSPSQNATARAERIEYHLQTDAIALADGREVFLRKDSNEIHARSLFYRPTPSGQLGLLESQGPGWMRGQSADQQIEATWRDQLRIDRDEQEPRISLTGGAELRFPGVAQLQSKEIFLWLLETATATKDQPFEYDPARMQALGEVRMNSAKLACRVEDLQVWFEEKKEGTPVGAAVELPPQQSQPTATGERPEDAVPGIGRVEVDGRLLTAKILLGDSQPTVTDLTIKEGVRFRETQTSQPGERPMIILGDLLVAKNLSEPNATVTVTGRKASFEGRELGLSGTNINLDRGANRLWINGPGQMNLQTPSSIASGMLTVDWRTRMEFDGRKAEFKDSVIASGRQLQVEDKVMDVVLRTEKMEVHLTRPVNFSESRMQAPPEARNIHCSGGVEIENRSFDQQRQLCSHDRMEVTDLGIDLLTGAMTGGPGRIDSVYRGSADPLGNPPDDSTAAPATDQLNGLHVRFQRSITGNVYRRRLQFDDEVRLTYAPVDNWDAILSTNDPDELNPQGVVASCDLLSLNQMLLPMGDRRSVELVAQGNVVIENSTYTARGHRAAYNQAKELLILEGDGRNDAELLQQRQPGAPVNKTAAQGIHYWLITGKVNVIGARSLQIGRPPGDNQRR